MTALKLNRVAVCDKNTPSEWHGEHMGCQLKFSHDRSTFRISKIDGDGDTEVWYASAWCHSDNLSIDIARGGSYYKADQSDLTENWSDDDWKSVDFHARLHCICSDRDLWREYYDPDENYTDEDWENESVSERLKLIDTCHGAL